MDPSDFGRMLCAKMTQTVLFSAKVKLSAFSMVATIIFVILLLLYRSVSLNERTLIYCVRSTICVNLNKIITITKLFIKEGVNIKQVKNVF